MLLPNGERARDGRSKAEFVLKFGFNAEQWNVAQSKHGLRYTVDGVLRAPDGREPKVRTVWITTPDDDAPRLVTAYPMQESE